MTDSAVDVSAKTTFFFDTATGEWEAAVFVAVTYITQDMELMLEVGVARGGGGGRGQ